MLWILLIFISAAAWAVSLSFQRIALRDRTSVTIFNLLYVVSASVFFIPALFNAKLPSNIDAWLFFLLSMAIWNAASLFMRLQHRYIDVPLQTALITMETLFAFSLGIIFLREQITFLKIVGLIAITIGIIVSGIGTYKKGLLKTAILIVAVASLLSASANVVDKYVIQFFDPFFFGFCMFFFSSIISIPLVLKKGIKEVKRVFLDKKWLVIISGILAGVSYLSSLIVYKMPGTEISKIYPLYQFFMLIAIPISLLITKEKQNLLFKVIGAVIATIGAILIIGI